MIGFWITCCNKNPGLDTKKNCILISKITVIFKSRFFFLNLHTHDYNCESETCYCVLYHENMRLDTRSSLTENLFPKLQWKIGVFFLMVSAIRSSSFINERTPPSVVDIVVFECNFLGKFHWVFEDHDSWLSCLKSHYNPINDEFI